MKNTRAVLFLIWFCFAARGFLYSAMFPMWEGYDEPFHFAYLQQLITNGKIPGTDTRVSRELQQSLHLLPLPWILSQEHLPPPLFSHDEYWRLSQAEREHLQKQFREMPLHWAEENATETISNYETQQAPFYYLLFSFPLKWMANLSLASRVIFLRALSILLASCAVPLGYLVAVRVLDNKNAALSILVLVTALPELFVDLSRVGNESLALVLYTLVVFLGIRVADGLQDLKYLLLFGISLGLGLLTKAYFLTAVPVFLLIVLWCYRQRPHNRKRLTRDAAIAGAVLLAIAGPWYWRIHTATGSWSGEAHEAALRSMSRLQILTQIPHVNWIRGIISILLSHIWFGSWSFLKLSRPVYVFFGIILLAAVVGLFKVSLLLLKCQRVRGLEFLNSGKLLALLLFYAFFCAGLAYDILFLYIHLGVSASNGWYIYSLVIVEALLLYLGLLAILPRALHSWILPVLTSLFVLLDLYGVHFLLIPYYTGVISHTAQDRVVGANIGQLMHIGVFELAQRLSVNKPTFLGPEQLIFLWVLFLLATASLSCMAFGLRESR